MDIKARLAEEMKQAAKARDKLRLSTIRLMRNAITNAELEKGKDLDDTAVIEILGKLARQYEDSIEAYKKGNRADLVEKETAELNVLKRFLPQALSPEEIAEMVKGAIERLGATTQKDMGKVMQELKSEYVGRASGKDVSEEVKRQLAANSG
jgi:uncharacterized protein YqeY